MSAGLGSADRIRSWILGKRLAEEVVAPIMAGGPAQEYLAEQLRRSWFDGQPAFGDPHVHEHFGIGR
jgi:hypothetical protein